MTKVLDIINCICEAPRQAGGMFLQRTLTFPQILALEGHDTGLSFLSHLQNSFHYHLYHRLFSFQFITFNSCLKCDFSVHSTNCRIHSTNQRRKYFEVWMYIAIIAGALFLVIQLLFLIYEGQLLQDKWYVLWCCTFFLNVEL